VKRAPDLRSSLPPAETLGAIRDALLAWYRQGHRDLPWRRTRDPYAIWISEIMLQQTRVDTVQTRFREFLERFPTLQALAAAPLEQVLALWSGLGYYARARNLHAAAQTIVARHAGQFPDTVETVRELPGIGPYTTGAILSIAFGKRAPILDGNVIRVASRLFTIAEAPESSSAARKHYWAIAEALLPPDPIGPIEPPSAAKKKPAEAANDVGDFNQALMELGATVCVPQRPVCLVCPVRSFCAARKEGDPERYPPRAAARAVPIVRAISLIVRRGDQVLLVRRPASGLWGGLWEPPTLPLLENETEKAGLARLVGAGLGLPATAARRAEALPPFVHVLTHREMRFSPYSLSIAEKSALALRASAYEAERWITPGEPLALGLASWVSALLSRVTDKTSAAAGPLFD
jgi:A/G-specific adenine glycosylase